MASAGVFVGGCPGLGRASRVSTLNFVGSVMACYRVAVLHIQGCHPSLLV